jgi:hypothetical protein
MRSPKYPLEPLAKLRDQRVDEATRDLAGAVGARTAAEGARKRAQERVRAHEDEARRVREAETAALERGELTAGDLARLQDWERGTGAERDAMERDVAARQGAEDRSREAERQAKEQLAARMSDARVVERDRVRWEEGVRKRLEAKEEEAVEDAAGRAARRRGPPR